MLELTLKSKPSLKLRSVGPWAWKIRRVKPDRAPIHMTKLAKPKALTHLSQGALNPKTQTIPLNLHREGHGD